VTLKRSMPRHHHVEQGAPIVGSQCEAGMSGDIRSPEGNGDLEALYGDLRRIAASHARRLTPHATLQPTLLVHEAWLRLSGRQCGSRTHYLALASRAMRHFVIDYLRAKMSNKRGGARVRVPLDEAMHPAQREDPAQAIDIDRLLVRLADEAPRKARVVEMLVFAGMDFSDTAKQLNVSVMTVRRDWQFCKAWLCAALAEVREA
jgi:RNA polymerase sigma factor (TIGR02999 family)